jgi:predicted MFS family arabinose efflux permease
MAEQPHAASGALERFKAGLHSPVLFLSVFAFVNMLGYAGWASLFNNFAKEAAGFSGADIGLAQSVREIPGFLAFTAIFWFMVMREQMLGYLSGILLGIGIAMSGLLPTLSGILLTTFIMSVGFHYFETVNQSLALQLFPKKDAARLLGRVHSAAAAAQFIAYSSVAMLWWIGFQNYSLLFGLIGFACVAIIIAAMFLFPQFKGPVEQHKTIVLRSRYWLYYALTLMNGARRQIFSAFAGFLLVEKFGFNLPQVAMLMLTTALFNTFVAPHLGRAIGRFGERKTIAFENIVLICVFLGYATIGDWRIAACLYLIDGIFSTLAIAQKTYIQKIGAPEDMAPTAACAFTINHIAAVVIPVTFGLFWLKDPSIVFYLGAVIATTSFLLSFLVPHDPGPGNETIFKERKRGPIAAAQPAE